MLHSLATAVVKELTGLDLAGPPIVGYGVAAVGQMHLGGTTIWDEDV